MLGLGKAWGNFVFELIYEVLPNNTIEASDGWNGL
jgi:hypothetical protein